MYRCICIDIYTMYRLYISEKVCLTYKQRDMGEGWKSAFIVFAYLLLCSAS